MQTIKHRIFGTGEVIRRENKENGTYLTVRFANGNEMKLGIPGSFETEHITAEGSLKDEVDAAIATKRASIKEHMQQFYAANNASSTRTPSTRQGRTPANTAKSKSKIEAAYEAYLTDAGYSIETPSGNRSTVYAYISSIENHVLEEEHISWESLKNDIDNIVKLYDAGGIKERIGAKSNFTVINALKRFNEFVNS